MIPQLILLSIFGLALLLAGWPLFRILLVLAGAVAGFALGPELLQLFTGHAPAPAVAWLSAVFAALLLASLSWLVFWLAVFVGSAAVVYGLVFSGSGNPVPSLIAALLAGVLAAVLQRPAIIILSSAAGAWLLVSAGLTLSGAAARIPAELAATSPWVWLVMLVLTVLGALVQLRSGQGRAVRYDWR